MSAGDQVRSCDEEGSGSPDTFHGEGEGGANGGVGVCRRNGWSDCESDWLKEVNPEDLTLNWSPVQSLNPELESSSGFKL